MDNRRVVDVVLDAIAHEDWVIVTRYVHPYVHWNAGGEKLRGRRNVLGLLATSCEVVAPDSWELREGQIYRWTSP
jgi:hypothetical protein